MDSSEKKTSKMTDAIFEADRGLKTAKLEIPKPKMKELKKPEENKEKQKQSDNQKKS